MTDAEVTTPTAPPPAKPKRARKAKPKPPAAPKAEAKQRAKPRTLRSRINDLGAYCLEAFDRQRKKGGDAYEAEVRKALDAADALRRADMRLLNAKNELEWAKESQDDAVRYATESQLVIDSIYATAKRLAAIDGGDDTPETPTI